MSFCTNVNKNLKFKSTHEYICEPRVASGKCLCVFLFVSLFAVVVVVVVVVFLCVCVLGGGGGGISDKWV